VKVLETLPASVVETEERRGETFARVTLATRDGERLAIRVPLTDLEAWDDLLVTRARLEIRVVRP
jgi:hypothetical protein